MKTKILLVAMLILSIVSFGQNQVQKVPEVHVSPPSFTGVKNDIGMNAQGSMSLIDKYLNQNIQVPKQVISGCREGTEVVQFVVKANGELTDIKVINSVCPEIDEEFVRVLRTTEGMWNPGFNNEKPVDMEKEISMMIVDYDLNNIDPASHFTMLATKNFDKGGKLFYTKDNARKALKYFDRSIRFLPNETATLTVRGLCKYKLGDKDGACSDWERINRIGKVDATEFQNSLCGMEGYAEMMKILGK